MLARTPIAALLVGTLASCSDSAPVPPACTVPGEARATGDPAGGELMTQFAITQYVFRNAIAGTGYVEINRGNSAGELTMDWSELVANGATVPARGQLIAGTGYGNCVSGPLDSELTMDADGAGATFVLRNLRAGPPFCGEEVSGTIVGCFRAPP